eukprot:5208607-Pleurochrysis_carterae.AAC.1
MTCGCSGAGAGAGCRNAGLIALATRILRCRFVSKIATPFRSRMSGAPNRNLVRTRARSKTIANASV